MYQKRHYYHWMDTDHVFAHPIKCLMFGTLKYWKEICDIKTVPQKPLRTRRNEYEMREHEPQENHLPCYSSCCMFMGQKCTLASCSLTTTSKLPTRWKYYLRGKCNLASNSSVPFPQWPLPLPRRQSLPEHDFPFFSLKNVPEAVDLVVFPACFPA